MGLSGAIFEMIHRAEAHRAAAKARREYTAHLRGIHMEPTGRRRLIEDKDISPEELLRVKQEIVRQIRRERQRALVLTAFVGLLAAAAVVGILFFVLWVVRV